MDSAQKAVTQVVDLSEFVAPAAGTALSAEGFTACRMLSAVDAET